MNAVVTPPVITPQRLILNGNRDVKRKLLLEYNSGHGYLTGMVYRSGPPTQPYGDGRMLAYASAPIAGCRLDRNPTGDVLWLERTAFDVTEAESVDIREALPNMRVAGE